MSDCTFQPSQPAPQAESHPIPFIRERAIEGETLFPRTEEPTLWSYAAPVVAEVTIDDRLHPRRVYHRNELRLTAPGVDIVRVPDEACVIRSLTLPQKVFAEVLGERPGPGRRRFAPLQRHTFTSPLIESVLDRLQSAATDPSPVGALYYETLINSVVLELGRLCGSGALKPGDAGAALSAGTLRALDRFIDAHLSDKIELRDLARIANMPHSSFQRMFKEATGATPYQHVLGRRIAHARCQIERSSLTLTEIAYKNGFSSQSHMTDVFRAKLGVTPGAIRKSLV